MSQTQQVEEAVVRSLRQSADKCRGQGEYRQAESLYKRALALAESNFGPDHIEISVVLNNLAALYKYIGEFDEAERLYRRALAITEAGLGPDHPNIATIYHNLGGLECARGCFAMGEPFARRSVEIREKVMGPGHVDVAVDISALAAILDGQKKFDESEPLYRRALAIFGRAYGPEHYEIAVNLNNLAALKYAKGEGEEAERLYQRALAMMNTAKLEGAESVPPLADALPGFDVAPRIFVLAPAGTPNDIVDKLSAALRSTVEMPDVKARLLELGINAAYVGGDELREQQAADIEAWKQVAREANIHNE